MAKVLELQHQSFQWIFRVDFFRIDWFDLLAVQGTLNNLLQYHSSKASIIWYSVFFYCPVLTSIHDYWKNYSFDHVDLCQQSDIFVLKCQLIGKSSDAGKERRQEKKGMTRGQDGWMASPTQWTWVWASSVRWWRTKKPCMLQSVESQSQIRLSDWTTTCFPLKHDSFIHCLSFFLLFLSFSLPLSSPILSSSLPSFFLPFFFFLFLLFFPSLLLLATSSFVSRSRVTK